MPFFTKKLNEGVGVAIRLDDKEMKRHIRAFSGRAVGRVISRALNKGGARAYTQAGRSIAKARNIKVGDAKGAIRKRNAKANRLQYELKASGASIPLMDTKGAKTQTKRGVKANPGGGRRLFEHAFIATKKSGRPAVFRRKYLGSERAKARRIEIKNPRGEWIWSEVPIEEIRLPSVPSTLVDEKIIEAMEKVGIESYRKALRNQIEQEVRRAKG